MYQTSTRLEIDTARTMAHGAIGVGYTAIGDPFLHPARMILIQNGTDADLWCSKNGVDDNFMLFARTSLLLDITSNSTFKGGSFFQERGARLYVKQIGVPTSGIVSATIFYGVE
jgi:hypothetical protein